MGETAVRAEILLAFCRLQLYNNRVYGVVYPFWKIMEKQQIHGEEERENKRAYLRAACDCDRIWRGVIIPRPHSKTDKEREVVL